MESAIVRDINMYTFSEIPLDIHHHLWEFHYFYQGEGTYFNGDHQIKIFPGVLTLSGAGEFHSALSKSQDLLMYFHVLFEKERLNAAIQSWEGFQLAQTTAHSWTLTGKARLALQRIRTRFATGNPLDAIASDLLFEVFLCDLAKGNLSRKSATDDGIVDKILLLMHESLTKDLSLDRLSQETGIEKTSLIRKFNIATGQPPHRYFLDLKIRNAAVILAKGNLKVRDIASNLGFYDEFHFSKQFKAFMGVSPRMYRESFQR